MTRYEHPVDGRPSSELRQTQGLENMIAKERV